MDCALLASGAYHASCALDIEELAYLKRTRILRWTRLILALITVGAAAAAVSCEVIPLRHYRGTAFWPPNLDLRPTIALLSSGCVIALLSLVYIMVAILPSPHSHIKLLNIIATLTGVPGLIAALVSFVLAILRQFWTSNETLHSWTCKWKSPSSNGLNEDTETTHFGRYCTEARVAFVLTGVLVALEALIGITVVVGFLLERRMKRKRKYGRFGLEEMSFCAKNGRT